MNEDVNSRLLNVQAGALSCGLREMVERINKGRHIVRCNIRVLGDFMSAQLRYRLWVATLGR